MTDKPKLKFSLQTRVLFFTLLISTIILGISDLLSTMISVHALERAIGEQTTMAAHRLAAVLHRANTENFRNRFFNALDQIRDLVPNIFRVEVYASEGETYKLVISNSLPNERALEDFELRALKSGQPDTYMIEQANGKRQMVAVEPVTLTGNRAGLITIFSNLKPVSDLVTVHARFRFIMLAVSIVLLASALTLLLRRTVYRSVSHLVKTMNVFQSGKSGVRAQDRLPGEFGELARHLNHMLAQISEFQENMQQQIQAATQTLGRRNEELEKINLLLIQTQKRLVQAERLAVVGQVTATFAHEIGSPLSAVSTHLQILQESAGLDPAVRQRLRMADKEISRLCSIVEDLLSETRRPYRRISVDLSAMILSLEHLFGPLLQSRQVAFEFKAHSEGPFLIAGNPDQLQQLLLNLLNNSLDAIHGPGRIGITISRLQPASHSSDPAVQIMIQDTGSGIPQDKLEHIFEPFFTSKEFGKGTGLGLAVSREIVLAHGGQISVASPPGQGASVMLTFPEICPAAAERESNPC